MFVFFDPCLVDAIARWDALKRWERRELGQSLRALGLSYREIQSLIPVAKGTLSIWCRDVPLTTDQQERLRAMRPRQDDPEMVRLFISWATNYLALTPDRFTAKLHLHAGQDEDERKRFWSAFAGIGFDEFRKTFVKPEGTGHRKNVLYNGTIQVRITRSADLLHRLFGRIDALRDATGVPG